MISFNVRGVWSVRRHSNFLTLLETLVSPNRLVLDNIGAGINLNTGRPLNDYKGEAYLLPIDSKIFRFGVSGKTFGGNVFQSLDALDTNVRSNCVVQTISKLTEGNKLGTIHQLER